MRKLTLFLTIASVLTFASGLFAQTGFVGVDGITNLAPGDNTKLRAGNNHVVSIKYDFTGLTAKWSTLNAFELYSPDGAQWGDLVATNGALTNALSPAAPDGALRIFKYYTSSNAGVLYSGTAMIPYPLDPYGEPITNPTLFETPGPNPTAGTNPCNSRVAYSHAIVGLGNIGYQAPLSGIAFTLQFSTELADNGRTMCLDTVAGSGTVAWNWAKPAEPNGHSPRWDCDPFTAGEQAGPICFEVFEVPNIPPDWCTGTTGSVSFNHCAQGSFTLCANDGGDGPGPVTFKFAPGYETGFGTITGDQWTWSGPTVPQNDMLDVLFLANDGVNDSNEPFTLHVTTTNREPTLSCASGVKTLGVNKCDSLMFTAGDLDVCDLPLNITAAPVEAIAGTYSISGSYLVYCPLAGDELLGGVHFTITASDGDLEASCVLNFNPIVGNPYQVELEKIPQQFQGIYADMYIRLWGVDPAEGLGGFDFLVAYDASALGFQLAYEGDIYNQDTEDPAGCGWEYFTYRFGPYGNCGSACPSGMLRVIGLAETNNGPYHPDCQDTKYYPADPGAFPITLANLRFLVSNDRTLECQFVPVRFFWYNCGDNTLSNADGSLLMLSGSIFDFTAYGSAFIGTSVDNGSVGFPTYQGAQDECVCDPQTDATCKIAARRYVDFQNGGVDIACADSIDARGDINLNGLPYEIADAVMFTNYFIQGIGAFGTHIEGSIAASDTNADGLSLTVADLVYLIRVIIGDAVPYDKAIPVAANVTYGNGVFSVDTEMGAAHIVMSGDATPTLLATNMEMKTGIVDGNLNILIYSMEPNQSFSGNFLRVDGQMISAQFATFLGQPVNADVMPANFALHQNYPNPFNPTTKIRIEIPKAGLNYTLNIYNVTGQLVQTISGKSTGYDEVVWDASNNASGIYFYKLTAGDYSATKKAVLLK